MALLVTDIEVSIKGMMGTLICNRRFDDDDVACKDYDTAIERWQVYDNDCQENRQRELGNFNIYITASLHYRKEM